eukprot:gene8448-17417_t
MPTETPTDSPSVSPCPYVPPGNDGQCRVGNDLEFFTGETFARCRERCDFSDPPCYSFEYTILNNDVSTATCQLKGSRGGTLESCSNPNTVTYDNQCNTDTPTAAPTSPSCAYVATTTGQCRTGGELEKLTGLSVGDCKVKCDTSVTVCRSFEYTNTGSDLSTASCQLKGTNAGAMASCPNPSTVTYENECCPYLPSTSGSGQCRNGGNLAKFTGLTVSNCQQKCDASITLCRSFEYSISGSDVSSSTCQLKGSDAGAMASCPIANTVTYENQCCPYLPSTSSVGQCRAGGNLERFTGVTVGNCQKRCDASVTGCHSFEYTISGLDVSTATCQLKGSDAGAMASCPYPSTVTYENQCISAAPTMSPIYEPCYWYPTPHKCRKGYTIETKTGLTFTECKNMCHRATNPSCDTIEYVYGTGYCATKFSRAGEWYSCPDVVTYDYNCPTPTPTLAPVKSCVNLMLADTFGAGSGNAVMFVYDNYYNYEHYAATCDENPFYGEYCFDSAENEDGDYVNIIVHGYFFPFYWDAFWQVYISGSGELYTGNYKTVMKFVYNKVSVNGVMTYKVTLSDESCNIQPNEVKCDACLIDSGNGVKKTLPPPPPPKKVGTSGGVSEFASGVSTPVYDKPYDSTKTVEKGNGISSVSGKDVKSSAGITTSGSMSSSSSSSTATKGVALTAPKLVDPDDGPAKAEVSKADSSTVSWFLQNGLGAYYNILDETGLTYYYRGTICDSNGVGPDDKTCEINLAPGCYLYRVDGAFDTDADDIKWNFCGRKGGVSSQLTFCIDDHYKCEAVEIIEVDDICKDDNSKYAYKYGFAYKYIEDEDACTLAGTFDLGGKMAPLTEVDEEAIKAAINKEFTD